MLWLMVSNAAEMSSPIRTVRTNVCSNGAGNGKSLVGVGRVTEDIFLVSKG